MKKIMLSLSLILSTSLYALDFTIIGPCNKEPLFNKKFNITKEVNLGELSVEILTKNQIPFKGASDGINSIYNTPVGMDAIEIVSDTKMRAYGWCYSIDGVVPDVMPDQVPVLKDAKKILWWFAYSTNDMGKWIDYCVPSYNVRATQFCKGK
ncbi:MAG: DUF4430 domain-containing protein [Bacteriovoracaceae bacterium]